MCFANLFMTNTALWTCRHDEKGAVEFLQEVSILSHQKCIGATGRQTSERGPSDDEYRDNVHGFPTHCPTTVAQLPRF